MRLLPWLFAASIVACADEPVPIPSTDVALGDLRAAMASTFCELLFRCEVPNDDLIFWRVLTRDAAGCLAHAIQVRDPQLEDAVRLVGEGRADYDPVKMGACLARQRADCSYLLNRHDSPDLLLRVCAEGFSGKTALGGSCRSDLECSPDAWCDWADHPADPRCRGTCAARVPLAEPCALRQCVQAGHLGEVKCLPQPSGELFCIETRPGSRLAAASEPCGVGLAVGGVGTSTACGPGLWCSPVTGPGTCRPHIPIGAPCESELDSCEGNGACLETFGRIRLCTSVHVERVEGEPCGIGSGTLCDSLAGLECNAANRCVQGGDGSLGSACSSEELRRPCNDGLWCASDHTCQPTLADGMACDAPSHTFQCAYGDCNEYLCGAPSGC